MSETPETEQNVEAAQLETEPSEAEATEPDPSADASTDASDATGHPAVDAVLASLERLDDLPVGEHPPIFEEAHEALRSALAQARDGSPGTTPHKH